MHTVTKRYEIRGGGLTFDVFYDVVDAVKAKKRLEADSKINFRLFRVTRMYAEEDITCHTQD